MANSPLEKNHQPELVFLDLNITKNYKLDDETSNFVPSTLNIIKFVINQKLFINEVT